MLNKKKSHTAGKKLSKKEMQMLKGGRGVTAVAQGCPTNPIYCCYIVNSAFGQMAVMAACTTTADGRCMCGPTDACPI